MWQIINEYLGILIMVLGTFTFGKIVLNQTIKTSKIKVIILILLMAVIQTIIGAFFTDSIKTITIVIFNIWFYKLIFKINYKKATLLAILQMFILIIPDMLELFFMTKVLGLSKAECYDFFAKSVRSNTIIYILLIIITYILRKVLRKLINEKLEDNKKIISQLVLTFICVLMFFYSMIEEFRFQDNIMIYITSISVLIIVLVSLIKQTIDNKKLLEKYDKLLDFMTTYETEIENQRILRHEIKNEFRTIRAKICDKQKNKEIIEYIDEIVNDKYEVKQEKYAKFGYLPANGIKGLCYFKTQEAEEKGVSVSLSISKRIKNSTIYDLDIKQQRDFGRMLGVFLDNAIEASLDSEEKKMGIEAYTNINKEFKIIISNTFNNQIDKNKIGKEGFSTKGKTRGHGLLLVKRIMSNNNIFETKTDIQENLYIQTIIVKKL